MVTHGSSGGRILALSGDDVLASGQPTRLGRGGGGVECSGGVAAG